MKIPNIITAGFVCLLVLLSSGLSAQDPIINIQGILKDVNGVAVDDGTQSLTFRLYRESTGGTALWQVDALVTVVGGIYSHNLGSGTTKLTADIFASTVYFSVEVGGNEFSPRTQMTYAPYAISVSSAQQIAVRGCSGQVGDIKYSILPPAKFATQNGDCWVTMDGQGISGTSLASLMSITTVPDMSGMFLRATEYSGDNDPDRGINAVYSVQGDENKEHLHPLDLEMTAAGEHEHDVTVKVFEQKANSFGTVGISSGFTTLAEIPVSIPLVFIENPDSHLVSSGVTSVAPNHDHQITTNTTELGGGAESRPINMNFFIYIRVD